MIRLGLNRVRELVWGCCLLGVSALLADPGNSANNAQQALEQAVSTVQQGIAQDQAQQQTQYKTQSIQLDSGFSLQPTVSATPSWTEVLQVFFSNLQSLTSALQKSKSTAEAGLKFEAPPAQYINSLEQVLSFPTIQKNVLGFFHTLLNQESGRHLYGDTLPTPSSAGGATNVSNVDLERLAILGLLLGTQYAPNTCNIASDYEVQNGLCVPSKTTGSTTKKDSVLAQINANSLLKIASLLDKNSIASNGSISSPISTEQTVTQIFLELLFDPVPDSPLAKVGVSELQTLINGSSSNTKPLAQIEKALRQEAAYSIPRNSLYKMYATRLMPQDGSQPTSWMKNVEEAALKRYLDPNWHRSVATLSQEALLRELVQMQAFQLYMDHNRYLQQERLEALLSMVTIKAIQMEAETPQSNKK